MVTYGLFLSPRQAEARHPSTSNSDKPDINPMALCTSDPEARVSALEILRIYGFRAVEPLTFNSVWLFMVCGDPALWCRGVSGSGLQGIVQGSRKSSGLLQDCKAYKRKVFYQSLRSAALGNRNLGPCRFELQDFGFKVRSLGYRKLYVSRKPKLQTMICFSLN